MAASSSRLAGASPLRKRMARCPAAPPRGMSMKQEWREIPGYPRYRISEDGAIKDLDGGKPLPVRTAKDGGYPKVFLRDHLSGVVHHYVHNLVARTFIGPPTGERPLVMHLDHNPQNNHVSNLRWGTHKTNAAGR